MVTCIVVWLVLLLGLISLTWEFVNSMFSSEIRLRNDFSKTKSFGILLGLLLPKYS